MTRRTINGYLDMGKIRIPPLPEQIVMTDRADGTLWLLSHNNTILSDDRYGYISINSAFDTRNDVVIYPAYEGPLVLAGDPPETTIRLLIRGALLGYETEPFIRGIGLRSQAGFYTRKGVSSETRKIIIPTTWKTFPDMLGWTPDVTVYLT